MAPRSFPAEVELTPPAHSESLLRSACPVIRPFSRKLHSGSSPWEGPTSKRSSKSTKGPSFTSFAAPVSPAHAHMLGRSEDLLFRISSPSAGGVGRLGATLQTRAHGRREG